MRNAGLEETRAGIKIAGRNINNLRYADDTTLMAESEEELKNCKDIEATILFADIRNLTSITEKNSPDTVFELLNEFLGGVEPIIRMNHGRVDKYIGDAVMAVFHKSSKFLFPCFD